MCESYGYIFTKKEKQNNLVKILHLVLYESEQMMQSRSEANTRVKPGTQSLSPIISVFHHTIFVLR